MPRPQWCRCSSPSDANLGGAGFAFSSGSALGDFAAADTHLPSFEAAIEQCCGTHFPLTYSSAYSSPDMMTRRLHKHVPETVNSPPRQFSASVRTQVPPAATLSPAGLSLKPAGQLHLPPLS